MSSVDEAALGGRAVGARAPAAAPGTPNIVRAWAGTGGRRGRRAA